MGNFDIHAWQKQFLTENINEGLRIGNSQNNAEAKVNMKVKVGSEEGTIKDIDVPGIGSNVKNTKVTVKLDSGEIVRVAPAYVMPLVAESLDEDETRTALINNWNEFERTVSDMEPHQIVEILMQLIRKEVSVEDMIQSVIEDSLA